MVPTVGFVLSLQSGVDKKKLLDDVRGALYASKICSYAQGLNIIRAKSIAKKWGIDMGSLTRIWKVGGKSRVFGEKGVLIGYSTCSSSFYCCVFSDQGLVCRMHPK